MSIRIKILILFTALTVSIILLMTGCAYFLTNQYSFTDFYKRLEIRAIVAARAALIKDRDNSATYTELRNEHLERMPYEQEYFLKVDSTGHISHPKALAAMPGSFYEMVQLQGKANQRIGDTFYTGVLFGQDPERYIVIVSARNDFGSRYMADLKRVLIICLGTAGILVLAAGFFFSRYILQPVRLLTAQVKTIKAHNLHMRLDPPDSHDEMNELAQTFNNMLDRLETAFETQNNFVSNASHELGTPLTAIIGEAELALNKQRSDEEYRQSIKVILTEAERLEHITKSLLRLAQTGFGGKMQKRDRIRMDELIFSVKDTIDEINPNNRVEIDYSLLPEDEAKLFVLADTQLLHLAFSNIIQNACKYSDNRPVSVALAATDTNIILLIRDQGIGIPSSELGFIYDPFFRASNTSGYKGYGIGLPLARNIIRLHGGNIIVNSQQGHGTEIRITLPAA
jgi:signal transduction histidine kinase